MSLKRGQDAAERMLHLQKDKKQKPVRRHRKTTELVGGNDTTQQYRPGKARRASESTFLGGVPRTPSVDFISLLVFNPQLSPG